MERLTDDAKAKINGAITTAVSAISGLEIVEIRYFNEYGKLNLFVFIWSREGIDLNACENAHNAISASLDPLDDLFPTDYVLNVSSSGLDRPIVSNDDFRRALDTEIEVKCDRKSHGILTAYDEKTFTVNDGKKEIIFNRDNTTKVLPYIRF